MTTPHQTVPTSIEDILEYAIDLLPDAPNAAAEQIRVALRELLSATTSRDEALAACGEMREALEDIDPACACASSPKVRKALLSTAGQSTLDELARLRAEVEKWQKHFDDCYKDLVETRQERSREQRTALQKSRASEERVRYLESCLREIGGVLDADCDPQEMAREALTKPANVPREALYSCALCGTMRTAAEGGATFTVCDECWDKLPLKPSASGARPFDLVTFLKSEVGEILSANMKRNPQLLEFLHEANEGALKEFLCGFIAQLVGRNPSMIASIPREERASNDGA